MKNQKIAILTFFKSGNFGGELQAYALQKKLRVLGYDVEVLHQLRPVVSKDYVHTGNFTPIYVPTDNSTRRSKINRKIVKLVSQVHNIFFGRHARTRAKRFEQFEKEHINLTKRIFYSFDELYNENLGYDTYIVGSDQVWNFEYPFSPEPYFLTFAERHSKRISYAASIGHSKLPEEIAEKYKEWLKDFDFISTREEQAAQLVKEITGRSDVKTVLDPSLLIKKDEWKEYLKLEDVQTTGERYLLIYTLIESKHVFELAIQIANRLNLKIKRVIPRAWTRENYPEVENIFDAGPKEFVQLFMNASFVITNSFHGTAFSINFNVPFLSVPRTTKKTNSRFVNILKLTGLEARLIYDGESRPIDDLLTADFTTANEQLDNERKKAIQYLVNALDSKK